MAIEHSDPFSPILRTSVTPYVFSTEEQEKLITDVLNLSSSDSRFAQKALQAIKVILAGGTLSGIPPTISGLAPSSAQNGNLGVVVRVLGTGYDSTCIIRINGVNQTTTFVSSTELRTTQNITSGNKAYTVRNGAGEVSNSSTFTVT